MISSGYNKAWLVWARWLVVLVGVSGLRGALWAQEVVTAYHPPKDVAKDWAKTGGVTLALLAVGLILYALVVRRRRLHEFSTKWLLFLGICVLPVPALFLGAAVGMEQSKTVEFCASCHVMDPFVNDLRDPESGNLAAVHYKQRYIQRDHCYRCHTDYGIMGNFEAKMSGLSHVWKAVTASYKLPVKLYKPYRYTICLDCHGEAQKFLLEASHEGVVEEVLAGETSCLDCHEGSHPAPEERSTE